MQPIIPPGKEPPKYDADKHMEWLEKILSDGVNLTVWEEEFIDSMQGSLTCRIRLTRNQEIILERIYMDRTP